MNNNFTDLWFRIYHAKLSTSYQLLGLLCPHTLLHQRQSMWCAYKKIIYKTDNTPQNKTSTMQSIGTVFIRRCKSVSRCKTWFVANNYQIYAGQVMDIIRGVLLVGCGMYDGDRYLLFMGHGEAYIPWRGDVVEGYKLSGHDNTATHHSWQL